MDLASILESLLIASESPLPTSELARLVRTRAAELSDDSITENPEHTLDPDSPEASLDLAKLSQLTDEEVILALTELNKTYEAANRSFVAAERSKGWKIYTKPDYAGFVKLLFPGRKPERLSAPAMETLAIIAYRQPITRAEIEQIRGVAVDGVVQTLVERELIEVCGEADAPGRPRLYGTTQFFLEHFGLKGLDELPAADELRRMQAGKTAQSQHLSSSSRGRLRSLLFVIYLGEIPVNYDLMRKAAKLCRLLPAGCVDAEPEVPHVQHVSGGRASHAWCSSLRRHCVLLFD